MTTTPLDLTRQYNCSRRDDMKHGDKGSSRRRIEKEGIVLRATKRLSQKRERAIAAIDVVLVIDQCRSIDDDRRRSQVAINVDRVDQG